MSETTTSSITDNTDYVTVCQYALKDDNIFSNFKRITAYNNVLEHVSPEHGFGYYNHIKSQYIIDNIQRCQINDKIGNPFTCSYQFGTFSPTSLRYAKVLNDISSLCELNGSTIVEIGAGYGGQYTILRQFFTPKKYIFVDLPDTLALIMKYITSLGLADIEIEYLTSEDLKEPIKSDLLISNYAFSECYKKIQDVYIEKLVNHAARGYMTYNHIDLSGAIYTSEEFRKKTTANTSVTEEEPLTAHANSIVYW